MVSSIVPGATGANALGVEPRFSAKSLQQPAAEAATGDRVEVSENALAASRDSVREALTQLQQTLALSHDAQATLLKVQELARSGGDQAELTATLQGFAQRIESAISDGAKLAAGASVSVQAEPDAAPVVIAGLDLRLGSETSVLALVPNQQIDDADLPVLTQSSLDALQSEVGRLLESTRSLEAHQGFLGAAEASGRGDYDADTARLIALQVRQGLEALGQQTSIANAEPQAVLSLFRA